MKNQSEALEIMPSKNSYNTGLLYKFSVYTIIVAFVYIIIWLISLGMSCSMKNYLWFGTKGASHAGDIGENESKDNKALY
jgi:hypothetical protein